MPLRWLLVAAALSLLPYLYILVKQIPVFKTVPGYFWHFMAFHRTPMADGWVILVAVAVGVAVVWRVVRRPGQSWINLGALMGLAFSLQMSVALSSGHGMAGIYHRLNNVGHTEFLVTAVLRQDTWAVATDYETFCRSDERLKYAHTKPPGQQLTYMMAERAANLFHPASQPEERYRRLVMFAGWAFTALSTFALIPLFLFARRFVSNETALVACALYVVVPSILLVTMHFDQVLYPLLSMTTLFFFAKSAECRSWRWGLCAGTALYLSLFVSFSLLPLVPAGLAVYQIVWSGQRDTNDTIRSWAVPIGGALAGVVLVYLVGLLVLEYRPFVRFAAAMAYHREWEQWQPGVASTLVFAGLNLIEFAWWVGLPLATAFVLGLGTAVRRAVARRLGPADLVTITTTGMVLALALFGQTKGEVARLWIFLIPLACLGAAVTLVDVAGKRWGRVLPYIAGLQLVVALLLKRYQDFW